MINEIKKEVQECMGKILEVLGYVFVKICIGCVYLSILDSVMVFYYGVDMLLCQVVNVIVEDFCILVLVVFDKSMIQVVEKVIMIFDLGFNLVIVGIIICVLMLVLIEEICKGYIKQVCVEVEQVWVFVCNICCDVLVQLKDLQKEKEISEDEECCVGDDVQKLIDKFIGEIEKVLEVKEVDFMVV